jgi:hypothetical protein
MTTLVELEITRLRPERIYITLYDKMEVYVVLRPMPRQDV